MSRRTFCLGTGGVVVALGLGGGLKLLKCNSLVRPPGGQDEDHLLSACIHCEKCFEICPKGLISPSHIENGLAQMRTPYLEFSRTEKWCDWCREENNGTPLCVSVCPTQALKLQSGASQDNLNFKLGTAEINEDWCLAYNAMGCRFCYDACEFDAITLDNENRPVMVPDKCNGCGACESVCVSMKEGSISEGANARAIIVKPLNA